MSDDEHLYARVVKELEAAPPRKGLFAKALSQEMGDKSRAQALYVRWRVEQLSQEEIEKRRKQTEEKRRRWAAEKRWKQAEEQRRKQAEGQRLVRDYKAFSDNKSVFILFVLIIWKNLPLRGVVLQHRSSASSAASASRPFPSRPRTRSTW